MRLHRFYIADSALAGEKISPSEVFEVPSLELAHQLKSVFRFRTGDRIILFSGDGLDHECLIEGFGKESVSLEAVKSEPSRFMPVRDMGREIWLCAALVKKDTFEWIAEKAVELGVSHIVPVVSERSEKKSLNMGRLEKIIVEASEQSGRGDMPAIEPICEFAEAFDFLQKQAGNVEIAAFHTTGEVFNEDNFEKGKPAALFIGPEGGWSESELALFEKHQVPIYCLGKQVLRAETAAIAALALIAL